MRIYKKYIAFIVTTLLVFISCNKSQESVSTIPVKNEVSVPVIAQEYISDPLLNDAINFSHFNHLYKEIDFKGKKIGIVHIYSSYPNYNYDIEPNEGYTCVDDVARAIVMLSKYLEVFGNDEIALEKMKNLTEFVLQMQNENGYFNNFLWNNLTINTKYRTSVAVLDWWSFRALLGLESAYPFLKSDADIGDRIILAAQKLIANIKRDLPITNLNTEYINSIELPTWLPGKSASDQSAILILGLLKNYIRTGDVEGKLLIDNLAKGIMLMQKGDAENYPYGAFLSSENLWHAWGNNQAYALLKAGQNFNNQEYIDSALLEIDNFYPQILQNGFAEAFWINKTDGIFVEIKRNKYPQIAYGLRPMVWAATEAYKYSNNEKHLALAKELELWLSGKNDANKAMYNPSTGICFDGITGPNEVNKNSGAESTIESLLILLEMEKIK
ncbi:MAG: hypothetical protein JJE44_05465 [Flavobacteriaceae bacterium]|nr:hypothetical protein [Flavobacteriaceae bacterium]